MAHVAKRTRRVYYSRALKRPNWLGITQTACARTETSWVIVWDDRTVTEGFDRKRTAVEHMKAKLSEAPDANRKV